MKKSSTRSSRVEKGHIDSALRTACEEKDANVAATLLGDVGEGKPLAADGDSSRRFLIASACRLGGPRLRLGLSNVHGISNAVQARHGGPDSSHCVKKKASTSTDLQISLECVPSLSGYYKNHTPCANGFPSVRPHWQTQAL